MDTFQIAHFSLGPLMLVLGFIFKRFPPKKINSIYGYRTPRSMRSQEAWDFANRYSADCLIIASAITCIVQVIFYTLMGGENSRLVVSRIFGCRFTHQYSTYRDSAKEKGIRLNQ